MSTPPEGLLAGRLQPRLGIAPEDRPPPARPQRCTACGRTYRTPRAYARHLGWCRQLALFEQRGGGWAPSQPAP
jgi:ribosomal protein S14